MRNKENDRQKSRMNRREVIQAVAVLGAGGVAAPYVIRKSAAQAADLGPYQNAKINWRQSEGEKISVAVIPASYFDNLITLTPEFLALTGIEVRYEKVPPGQIRQKAMLDLTIQDRHLRDVCHRPDVLSALCFKQMGGAARQISRRS